MGMNNNENRGIEQPIIVNNGSLKPQNIKEQIELDEHKQKIKNMNFAWIAFIICIVLFASADIISQWFKVERFIEILKYVIPALTTYLFTSKRNNE
jgi:NifU-like protein involved in Fe-S cluster formation